MESDDNEHEERERWESPIPEEERLRFLEERRRLDQEAVVRERRAAIRRQAVDRLESQCPPKYRDATWERVIGEDGNIPPVSVDKISGWMREEKPVRSLLILGEPGVGKTFAAWAIARWFAYNRSWGVEFRKVNRIFENLNPRSDEHRQERRTLSNADILVIDDLGASRSMEQGLSAFEMSVIDDLISARVDQEKPTIITTNLTKEELKGSDDGKTPGYLGTRTISRLSGSLTTKLLGEDRRGLS